MSLPHRHHKEPTWDPPPADKVARLKKKKWRILALRKASQYAPGGEDTLPDLARLRRVLLVALNFRLGNTLVASPGVAALVEALPDAEIDFVGGPAAPAVFEGMGLKRVIGLRRSELYSPLRLFRLLRDLRRRRYDAAIHLSMATGSIGGLLMLLSGASVRVGARRGEGNVYFTSTVEPPWTGHKIDRMREYVRLLGVPCDHERTMTLSHEEALRAAGFLAEKLGAEAPIVAFFVGGRASKGKAWDLDVIGQISARMRGEGFRILTFIGPEEKTLEAEIRAAIGESLFVEEPDVRRVAALVSRCSVVLTPDAGPMHLAIAIGTPTVALFRKTNYERWGPRPPHGEVVYDPDGADTDAAVAALLREARREPLER